MQKTKKIEHFGSWLERSIQEKGISVNSFGHKLGVAPATIYLWVRSKNPRIHGHNIARLAKALGIDRDEVEAKLAEAAGIQPESATAA